MERNVKCSFFFHPALVLGSKIFRQAIVCTKFVLIYEEGDSNLSTGTGIRTWLSPCLQIDKTFK